MELGNLSQETFSYKDYHRFNDNTFVLVIRDEEFPNSNLLSILYYDNGNIKDIDRYEMGEKILATRNTYMDLAPLSERFSLQQLGKISYGSIIGNDKYHEGSSFPMCITFHTNINPLNENEIIEIFEGSIREENAVLTLAEISLMPLVKDFYIGTSNVFFVLEDSFLKGPFKIKQIDVSGHLIIEKSYWKPFGKYEITDKTYVEFKANSITRRIIIPNVNELSLLEEEDFITDIELINKLETHISKTPDLYSIEHLSDSLDVIKRISIIDIKDNSKNRDRLLKILKDKEQDIVLNLEISKIIPELTNIKEQIDSLEKKKLSLNNEIELVEKAKIDKDQKIIELEDKITSLKVEIDNLNKQIEDIKKYKEEKLKTERLELEDQITELEKVKMSMDSDIQLEKEAKMQSIKELEVTIKYLENKESSLKAGLNTLQEEFSNEQKSAHQKLKDLLIQNQHYNILSGREFITLDKEHSKEYESYELQKDFENIERLTCYQNIKKDITEILSKSNRKLESHFIDNLLISIHQNTLTLLAGLPGTGKTSLIRLLINILAPKDRIREIAVGRGWSSQKDLIGFYNPLSSRFHPSQTNLYSLLEQLNWEWSNKTYLHSPLAYVLLDEANLSPLEHYWSVFYNLTDSSATEQDGLKINLGGAESVEYPNNLRFIGTINYDQTTEELSPRVVDRANIIKMDQNKMLDISRLNINEVKNLDISLKECIDIFELIDFGNEQNIELDDDFETKFNVIRKKFEELRICISPRVQIAIKKYCKVAKTVMYEQNKPMDYCIAQRLLPLIRIQGGNTRQKLKELKSILDENKYDISSKILGEIIQIGEEGEVFQDNFDYFLTLSHV